MRILSGVSAQTSEKCGEPGTIQREGPCKPLPRRRISRIVCDGGLSGYESKRLSDPAKRTSPPGHICERICFDVIILNSRFIRARFRCLRSRMDHHPFWGRGSNGCKSLTRSELGRPFPQLLLLLLSLRRAGRERCCAEPMWRPLRHGSADRLIRHLSSA